MLFRILVFATLVTVAVALLSFAGGFAKDYVSGASQHVQQFKLLLACMTISIVALPGALVAAFSRRLLLRSISRRALALAAIATALPIAFAYTAYFPLWMPGWLIAPVILLIPVGAGFLVLHGVDTLFVPEHSAMRTAANKRGVD